MDLLRSVTELGAHNTSLCAVGCEAGSVNLWAEQASSYEAGGCDASAMGWAVGFADPSQAVSSFRS